MSQFFNTKEETKQWLDDMEIKTYKINDDLTVDVKDSVYIYGKGLSHIPVKFGNVDGDFDCSYNNLITLEGSPSYVRENFFCNNNRLENIKSSPFYCGGDFFCQLNKLKNLQGAPISVGGYFDCSDNQLTNLQGAPKSVGRSFDCSSNKLTSLEGSPIINVKGYFICSGNNLIDIKDLPDCKLVRINGIEKYSNIKTMDEIFKQRDLEKAEYEKSILNTSINEVSQKPKPKIKFKI